MKNRLFSLAAVCVAASVVALLAGCFHPVGPGKAGALTVSIKNVINTRTLLPPISMDAASYTVEGTGPNGASFSRSSSGESVTVEELTFGTWVVTVNALNAEGTVIGQGQNTATLVQGQTVTLEVAVTPLGGTGSLELSVTWTASLQHPSIQASLTPPIVPALEFAVSGNQGTCSSSGIPAGYYTLTLQLLENNIPVMGAVEVVRIVSEQTTSGAYDFTHVNMGTVEVNITPALANPLPVNIGEVPATLPVGTSTMASASVSDGTPNVVYVWYVNGVSKGTGPSYTFGSDLGTGYYRLDVTAFTSDGLRGGSATANFQVVKTGIPGIVGSWNFFRAWARYTGLMRFDADGKFTNWDDLAETIDNSSGTWSLSGSTLTLLFDHGGPGSGSSLSIALTWVNANQLQTAIPGLSTPMTLYRKGTEPDGYLFNNPRYPLVQLLSGKTAEGILPSDGLALYRYEAGPNAQNTQIYWSNDAQVCVYVNEQTTVEPSNPRWVSSPHFAALAPGQTCFLVVSCSAGFMGGYSILVTDGPLCVGTWVNPAYNGGAGKIVLTATSNTFYTNDYDTTPAKTETYAIANDWTDDSGHYFRGIGSGGYFLMRVSNDNNTLEVDTRSTVDQASIDPTAESYVIFTRQ